MRFLGFKFSLSDVFRGQARVREEINHYHTGVSLVSMVSFGMPSHVCRDTEETLTVMNNKIENIRLARRLVSSSTSVAVDDAVVVGVVEVVAVVVLAGGTAAGGGAVEVAGRGGGAGFRV